MSTQALLASLFRYKAWADEALLDAMGPIEADKSVQAFSTALSVINHAHIVDRIFAAHLLGAVHNYETNEPPNTPSLNILSAAIREIDGWYVEHISRLSPGRLCSRQ